MWKTRTLFEGRDPPVMIEPDSGAESLQDAIVPELPRLREQLLASGAILLRGFKADEVADFHDFVGALSSCHFDYRFRSSPRESVTDRVHTSTSYPRQVEIPLHNEHSYQGAWPMLIAFYCAVPSRQGGETPIASTASITRRISGRLLEKFASRGVEYVRHYHAEVDLPWQSVFGTEDRQAMRQYCNDHHIEHEWIDGTLLRTRHKAQGTASHPVTGSLLFFNQAHLFHSSSLGEEQALALGRFFGTDRLPRHARFGDGSEISAEELTEIRSAYRACERLFPWRAGDVLLLDNMLYCHGRRPFEGERRVLAALMEPHAATVA